MTITEKILANKAGVPEVSPGEFHWCKVDRLFTHDPCAPGVLGVFEREFGADAPVFDPERVALIPDHFVFTTDPFANQNINRMRDFAKKKQINRFFDPYSPNYKGVCHLALVEAAMVRPGELLVGTDSHTVTAGAFGCLALGVGNTDAAYALGTGEIYLKVPETIQVRVEGELPEGVGCKDLILNLLGELGVDGAVYQAIEFTGPAIEAMSAEDRMTLCNMTTEAGAKAGIIAPNEQSNEYLAQWSDAMMTPLFADPGAVYSRTLVIDGDSLEPQVAKPVSPDNVVPLSECAGVEIEQVYVGSCTGGKLEDFVAFARLVKGKQVQVKTYGVPATCEVAEALIRTKIQEVSVHEVLVDAGVKLSPYPGCGACCGGPVDTFGRVNAPLKVLSTTNRNFPGRMGDVNAEVFLGSPQTAAATALTGRLTDPREVNDLEKQS